MPDPEPTPISKPLLETYVDQAYKYLEKGKLEEAKEKAIQALEIDQNYQRARDLLSAIKKEHYAIGWTYFDDSHYNEAITEFKKAINIDSQFKEAHFHLGVSYIAQKRYAEAINVFEKTISIDQRFKEAYFNLGLAHFEREEYEAAREAANNALEIDADYEPALLLIEFITKQRQ